MFYGSLSKAEEPLFPWLVDISSIYDDPKLPNGKNEVHGFGYVVRHGEKTFIFTASHVSNGGMNQKEKNPTLKIMAYDKGFDDTIEIKTFTRFIHNLWDVEILFIPNGQTLIPLAEYVSEKDLSEDDRVVAYGNFGVLRLNDRSFKQISQVRESEQSSHLMATSNARVFPVGLLSSIPFRDQPNHSNLSEIDLTSLKKYELQKIASTINLDDSDNKEIFSSLLLGYTHLSVELKTFSKIPKGLSGAPLITQHHKNGALIKGQASGLSRYFESGWATDHLTLIQLLNHYVSYLNSCDVINGWEFPTRTYWHSFNGQLYRKGDFKWAGFDFEEINVGDSRRDSTGGGTRDDSGGGTRDDSGGGTMNSQYSFDNGVLISSCDNGCWINAQAFRVTIERETPQVLLLPADSGGLQLSLNYLVGADSKEEAVVRLLPIADSENLVKHIRKHMQNTYRVDNSSQWYFSLNGLRTWPLSEFQKIEEDESSVVISFEKSKKDGDFDIVAIHLRFKDNDYFSRICGTRMIAENCVPFRSVMNLRSAKGDKEYSFSAAELLMVDPGMKTSERSQGVLRLTLKSKGAEYWLMARTDDQ